MPGTDVVEFKWNLRRMLRDAFPEGLPVTDVGCMYKKWFHWLPTPTPESINASCKTWAKVFQSLDTFKASFRITRRKVVHALPIPERDLKVYFRHNCYTQYLATRQGVKFLDWSMSESEGEDAGEVDEDFQRFMNENNVPVDNHNDESGQLPSTSKASPQKTNPAPISESIPSNVRPQCNARSKMTKTAAPRRKLTKRVRKPLPQPETSETSDSEEETTNDHDEIRKTVSRPLTPEDQQQPDSTTDRVEKEAHGSVNDERGDRDAKHEDAPDSEDSGPSSPSPRTNTEIIVKEEITQEDEELSANAEVKQEVQDQESSTSTDWGDDGDEIDEKHEIIPQEPDVSKFYQGSELRISARAREAGVQARSQPRGLESAQIPCATIEPDLGVSCKIEKGIEESIVHTVHSIWSQPASSHEVEYFTIEEDLDENSRDEERTQAEPATMEDDGHMTGIHASSDLIKIESIPNEKKDENKAPLDLLEKQTATDKHVNLERGELRSSPPPAKIVRTDSTPVRRPPSPIHWFPAEKPSDTEPEAPAKTSRMNSARTRRQPSPVNWFPAEEPPEPDLQQISFGGYAPAPDWSQTFGGVISTLINQGGGRRRPALLPTPSIPPLNHPAYHGLFTRHFIAAPPLMHQYFHNTTNQTQYPPYHLFPGVSRSREPQVGRLPVRFRIGPPVDPTEPPVKRVRENNETKDKQAKQGSSASKGQTTIIRTSPKPVTSNSTSKSRPSESSESPKEQSQQSKSRIIHTSRRHSPSISTKLTSTASTAPKSKPSEKSESPKGQPTSTGNRTSLGHIASSSNSKSSTAPKSRSRDREHSSRERAKPETSNPKRSTAKGRESQEKVPCAWKKECWDALRGAEVNAESPDMEWCKTLPEYRETIPGSHQRLNYIRRDLREGSITTPNAFVLQMQAALLFFNQMDVSRGQKGYIQVKALKRIFGTLPWILVNHERRLAEAKQNLVKY